MRGGATAWAVAIGVVGWACGGPASGPTPSPEGAPTPEQAVERFLSAAMDAQRARRSGQLTLAEQHYDQMASVFGTEKGSILRREDRKAVRDRMISLAGLVDPQGFRVQPGVDARARETGRTTITVELTHQRTVKVVPFTVIRGRHGLWYIERIDMRPITG